MKAGKYILLFLWN